MIKTEHLTAIDRFRRHTGDFYFGPQTVWTLAVGLNGQWLTLRPFIGSIDP